MRDPRGDCPMAKLKPEIDKPEIGHLVGIGTRYLDIKSAARILSMTPGAVYQLIYRREIPYYKFGRRVRIRGDELHAFMETKRVEADPEIAEALNITRHPQVAKAA
jgi:excisionase family DNA binding protein